MVENMWFCTIFAKFPKRLSIRIRTNNKRGYTMKVAFFLFHIFHQFSFDFIILLLCDNFKL
jgi:hypothetical protein